MCSSGLQIGVRQDLSSAVPLARIITPILALTPGTRLGVFELTELIGRGGMGEVCPKGPRWAASRWEGASESQNRSVNLVTPLMFPIVTARAGHSATLLTRRVEAPLQYRR